MEQARETMGAATAASAASAALSSSSCQLQQLVYENASVDALREAIKKAPAELDMGDPAGYTPLLLAVMLNRETAAEALVAAGADLDLKTPDGWSLMAEAVATGNPQLVRLVNKAVLERSAKKYNEKKKDIIKIILDEPDFSLHLHWNVHSWVPLVDKMLPSGDISLFKSGPRLKMQTMMKNAQNGNNTVMVAVDPKTGALQLTGFNDDKKAYFTEPLKTGTAELEDEDIDALLTTEVTDVDVKSRHAHSQRALAGIYGFRTPRTEIVHGYSCDVYTLEGLSMVVRKRREHLTPELIVWHKEAQRLVQQDQAPATRPPYHTLSAVPQPFRSYRDFLAQQPRQRPGRQLHAHSYSRNASPMLWMSEDFPLKIEKLTRLLQGLEPLSKHIASLLKFLDQTLPPGFPVKLDIPVFPTTSARVTFSDYQPQVDPRTFDIPPGYRLLSREEFDNL